jgi:ATP-dependent protease ClpP protease subunit
MLHEVSTFDCGKNQEIQASEKETNRLNKYLFQLMAKNCGHSDKNYFLNEIYARKNADWFLTPAEVLKHKLANKIHLPQFTTSISVNTEFC